MKLSQFIDVFVAALYSESQITGKSEFRIGELVKKYGLAMNPAWRESLFKDYSFSSRVDSHRHLGPIDQQRVSLSPDGFRWVEDELGENVSIFLERNGASYTDPQSERIFDPAVFDPGVFDTGEGEPVRQPIGQVVDSTAWTGLTRTRIDTRNAATASKLINQALSKLKVADNAGVAQARTLLLAARDLTDAPEPPSDIIWQLIQRAGAVVGLLDIFFRIFSGLAE